MVFMVIPVIAPGAGQIIMLFSDWRMIFVLMGLVSLAITVWVAFRLPETLRAENRRPFTVASIADGFRIVVTNRVALWYTASTTVIFGALFGFINSAQQVYVDVYGVGAWFPALFATVAGLMAVASFLNARLVGRFGMRRLSHGALLGFLAVNTLTLVLSLIGRIPLALFMILFAAAMFQFAWIGSNFNAMAMEPLGHVAGIASSMLGFVTTLGGGLIGAAIGQAFDGTVTPLAAGYCGASLIALCFVLIAERGRLFRGINEPAAPVV